MMGRLPVMPGQGEIEIKALVRSLRVAKYDGAIVVDHLPMHDTKIERELNLAYVYLQGIIS